MKSKFPFLSESRGGVYINVRVQPGASKTGLSGLHGTSLKVKVKAPPVEGAANEALVEFLCEILGVRKSSVTIASGERGREKKVFVEGRSRAEVEKILVGEFD